VAGEPKGSLMILYHFTDAENLSTITERGLVPTVGRHAETEALTLGIPVVWFTSNVAPLWLVGPGCGSDMCMLTVDLKRKHVRHWRTWLANTKSDGIDENDKPTHYVGTEILEGFDREFGTKRLTDTSNYWICTGIVRPHYIIECEHVSVRHVLEGAGATAPVR
jgi:hypothetical protein